MSLRGTGRATPDDGGGSRWPIGPRQPHLPSGSADVWWADLAAVGDGADSVLSDDERERAASIAVGRRRRAWSSSRAVLRELLGRYLRCDAAAVDIVLDARGKPSLAGSGPEQPLRFNLSHSGDLALFAFSASEPVGVDVQMLREDERSPAGTDHIALARRAFGEHEAQRLSLVEPARREREFLRAWTRHEAELKWRGTGIGGGASPADGAVPWTVELEVGARATAAIALSDRAIELRRWNVR
jgi:4'-phosphopantetheinyl transferase